MRALGLYSELSLGQLRITDLTEADALLRLHKSEEKLVSINVSGNAIDLGFHNYISAIHGLRVQFYNAEKAGCTKEEIMAELEEVRNIITRSPLIHRLYYWQRGYTGDLKTISRHNPFDLVYAGGLFDYLNNRHIEFFLKYLFGILKPGVTLFFTNIANYDPYRIWREHFTKWTLIERSKHDIIGLIQNAGIKPTCANINRDDSGLLLFVNIKKS